MKNEFKYLIFKNFNLNLSSKNIKDIIQKELCKLYSANYRKSVKPKYNLLQLLLYCKKYKRTFLRNDSFFIKFDEIVTILKKCNCEYKISNSNIDTGFTYFYNLTDYEELCPKCMGSSPEDVSLYTYCNMCEGNGYIDWINNLKNG